MEGWRARLGFMVLPGGPNTEPEMTRLAPRGVSVHFARLVSYGAVGTTDGQDARTKANIDNIDQPVGLLAAVKPSVLVLAHTASSYMLGREGEATLKRRIEAKTGVPFTSALASVVAAFNAMGVRRIGVGTPYSDSLTQQGKQSLEAHGFEVVSNGRLPNVKNIYDETPARAYALGRMADSPEAEAIFISGVGLPTIDVLDMLEQDLGKPVFSSASATMWNALRIAGVHESISGYGRLLKIV